jgi:hypothetical protein
MLNERMPIERAWWLGTAIVCAIAAVILLISGYQGYGAVLIAVGAAAAINLT